MTVVRSFLLRNVTPPILLLLLTSLLLSSYASSASARTWHVRSDLTGDWETIQIAINYAASGDTILVGPGTYGENLVIDGKELVLKSEVGPDATTLEGSLPPGSVIFCTGGLTNETVIEGFTITGGQGTDPLSTGSRYGGGISCWNAAPVIRKNIVFGNRAVDIPPRQMGHSRGGGINFAGADQMLPPIVIENNIIDSNFADANGGGINIAGPCIIRNNIIQGNSTGHGDGAGLYYISGQPPILIDSNIITKNIAADHGGGIYIGIPYEASPPPSEMQVIRNVIIGNEAHEWLATDGAGGGVWLLGGGYLFGNTIAFNLAESGQDPVAGGVCILYPRHGTVLENNLIQGNSEGGIVVLDGNTAGAVLAKHNLLFENGSQSTYQAAGMLVLMENIFADAYFCWEGPESSGELAEDSPALVSQYGLIGAVGIAGCGQVAVISTTWGRIKAMWRTSPKLGGDERRKPGSDQ